MLAAEAVYYLRHKLMYMRIIAGAERKQRYFVISRAAYQLVRRFEHGLHFSFPYRAIYKARLAEAAALGAAAEQLKRYAVVNNGDIRHDGLFYVLRPVKVHQYTALYLVRCGRFSFIHAHVLAVVAALFFIKRRNIYATYCGKLF